jgi:transcriptional regulator with PAS, ATPase and Fis domain
MSVFTPINVTTCGSGINENEKNDRAEMRSELRQLVDTAHAPNFGSEVNDKVTEWNNKTADIERFSKEETFDKPLVSTLIMKKFCKAVQEVKGNALKREEKSNYEF